MIPVKLRMQNFLCYRGDLPPLDFRGLHLACLAGQNGHGKSALLDAITWALWGKARTVHDNSLITLGEEDMEVEFDFTLADTLYRVIRKRSSKGRGRSALEFQVEHEGRFRPLTEPTITQTQKRIDGLLRMDYATFINSAFLLQGRANEFTTKAPADRKRILGDILGLDIYDAYEQRARDKAREAESEGRAVEARLGEIDRELANEPHYEAERRQAEAAVVSLSRELREADAVADRLRQEKRVLDLQRKQRQELSSRLARTERDLETVLQRLEKQKEQVARLRGIICRREEIESGYQALQEARAAEDDLSKKLSELMALNQEQAALTQEISVTRARLEAEQRAHAEKLRRLRDQIAESGQLQAKLGRVQAKLEALAAQETTREKHRGHMQALTAEDALLRATNEQLRQEMEALQEKSAMLRGAEAKCPLCGSDLSPEHRERVLSEIQAEGKAKGDRFRENKAKSEEIAQQIAALEEACQDIDKALGIRPGLQREEAALENALREAEKARVEEEALQQEMEALTARLEAGDYAREARAALACVEARVAALGYDAAAHEQARRRVEEYGHFEAEQRELEMAARLLEEATPAIGELEASAARRREELQKDREGLAELDDALAGAEELERRLQEATQRAEQLRTEESQARLRLGAAQQKLASCTSLRAERERQAARQRQLAEEIGIYHDLQTAFGQKGLRAMIIEGAIPEIEEEANVLLARMTENRMHVRFETQRETLKGDTVETLEIRIADELGTRSYEMYSGGEAFRVDFAIRIALSKLLARRAGAQLQTLFIDEGFGTQDAQGRERLVEAINSIRDDFACILVITHIEELQDAFPARINVYKTAEGSRFELT